jgi:hypothetical protein
MFKLVKLEVPEKPLSFAFPASFSEDAIKSNLNCVRTGHHGNWKREYRKTPVTVEDNEAPVMWVDRKYIVLHDPDKKDSGHFMVIFPKMFSHDFMFEVLQHIAYESELGEGVRAVTSFSAGFVTNNTCHGRSESMNVDGHKDDTKLLHETFVKKDDDVKI